jgi:hypothetical protein
MTISAYFNWLKKDWAKIGLILAVFLAVFLFIFVRPRDFVVFLFLLQTPLYMLHETEEYVFPGGFGSFFNLDIFKLDTPDRPLNENFIFYVNVLLVWVALPVFGLLSLKDYAFGLWIPYFSFFAGVAHVALALKARKLYNPGLVVSLVLNIPVSLWMVAYLVNQHMLANWFWNPHLAIGLGVNALLPVMGVILFKRHQNASLSPSA